MDSFSDEEEDKYQFLEKRGPCDDDDEEEVEEEEEEEENSGKTGEK